MSDIEYKLCLASAQERLALLNEIGRLRELAREAPIKICNTGHKKELSECWMCLDCNIALHKFWKYCPGCAGKIKTKP